MESIIFSVDGRVDLLEKVIKYTRNLTSPMLVGDLNSQVFSDGEVCVDLTSSVRGKRVYLLTSPNTSDKVLQLMFAMDAAKRGGAKEIIPILPYYPYARQDKKDYIRGAIGSKVLADMLQSAGATQVITIDLHADQIQGFFDIPVTHLEGKYIFDDYITKIHLHTTDELVLCAPDAGASKRVKGFRDRLREAHDLDLPIVMIDKTRPKANEIGEMVLIGDVEGKHVVIIDDMCDTGGTLVNAAKELLNKGASGVSAIVTHGVLSGPALERIYDARNIGILTNFICSNSLPIKNKSFFLEQGVQPKAKQFITILPVEHQIAKAIIGINNECSVDLLKQTH